METYFQAATLKSRMKKKADLTRENQESLKSLRSRSSQGSANNQDSRK